ncbi:hypothetical protein [Flavobacterium sp. C4GT6]|uniref:hypothetical protein n=1 Tax=Flavobacterium sp. C4GT6 TaxID=3103818 RepID=UPI002ED27E2B
MKLKVFYSWQSDLPNKTNRSFIENCLKDALKTIFENNNTISECFIESDSRNETGTPELANTIFSKIDSCDIFLSDISLISNASIFNKVSQTRKVCNPNVLIELGYASSRIGWNKILCVYNLEYGQIEDLPFDIRHRKPITYTSSNKNLTKLLIGQIQNIFDNHITNKKYFQSIKKEIDLAVQAILVDISKVLFFREVPKCYDYNFLLHMSREEIEKVFRVKTFLGFQLLKDNDSHIREFVEFFNDQVYINFLSDKEKNALAKIILQFKNLSKLISDIEVYDIFECEKRYALIDAVKMNKSNSKGSFILVEKINSSKSVVIDSGSFKDFQLEFLLDSYKVKDNIVELLASTIYDLCSEINEWIMTTGNFFIINQRLFEKDKI